MTTDGAIDFGSLMGVDYISQAEKAIADESYEEAASVLEQAVKHDPHNPRALLLRGKAKYHLGKLKGCIKDLNSCLKMDSSMKEAKTIGKRAQKLLNLSKKALGLFNSGEYEDAITVYDDALEVDADNSRMSVRLLTNRAAAMEKLERPEDAVGSYTAALTIDPQNQYSFFRRGSVYKLLGQQLEALYDMEKSMKLKRTTETEKILIDLRHTCNHYVVLGLEKSEDVTEKAVKKRYYLLARKWHPDKDTTDNERATALFRKINKSYNVLMNADKRAEYDKYIVQKQKRKEEEVEREKERAAAELWSPTLEGYRSLNRDYMEGSFGDEESGFSDEDEEGASSTLLRRGLQVLKAGMTAQALYQDGEWHPVVVDQYLFLTKSYFVTFLEFDEQECVPATDIRTTEVTLVSDEPKSKRKRKRKWDGLGHIAKKLKEEGYH